MKVNSNDVKVIVIACGLIIFAELFYHYAIPHWEYSANGKWRVNAVTGKNYAKQVKCSEYSSGYECKKFTLIWSQFEVGVGE